MRKFKHAFYGIYLIFFIFVGILGLTYEDLVLHWDWDWIETWTGLLKFVLKMGGVGSALFLTLIIIENIHLYSKDQKIKSLQSEINSLKAQMFDFNKNEQNISEAATQNQEESQEDQKQITK